MSPSVHNSLAAPKWGTLTHSTPHIIWSVHTPEKASGATTPTGLYGWVYGCTRGGLHPVYDNRDCREAPYTPSCKVLDSNPTTIWSCSQPGPPTHNTTVAVPAARSHAPRMRVDALSVEDRDRIVFLDVGGVDVFLEDVHRHRPRPGRHVPGVLVLSSIPNDGYESQRRRLCIL